MIQSFAAKFKKPIAYLLFVIFYLQTMILPLHAAINSNFGLWDNSGKVDLGLVKKNSIAKNNTSRNYVNKNTSLNKKNTNTISTGKLNSNNSRTPNKTNIGGPSSPEASTFKAVGSNNLVNLFTGDFSYSIPLLDVGGYPVNLFYSGGITMEQEASWVGLGWNINPGTVSRNMRGVPDDFNGEDKMIQTQNVKPNRTWGGEVGINGELIGIPKPNINLSLGFSYNNYLGPALEVGAGVSLNIPIVESIKPEKEATKADTGLGLSASVSLNAKLNSRSGLTFSPSLNAGLQLKNQKDNIGVGISTSYNSRHGIKELNLSMSTSRNYSYKYDNDKRNGIYSISGSIGSSSISFARPSYMPTLRMPMEYSNYSGQLELGAGMFGIRGGGHAQGYYSESKVPSESKIVQKPLVGFIYSEKSNGNKDAVMDFNRLNDAEVTPRTPILSAPQYAYDIFSIQGEGTGGSIRAYRGDLGFMRDNETTSKDRNISIGFDIAPAGHYGGNWNIIKTPTRVGGWEDGNNTLRQTLAFKAKQINTSFENIYFRNPGEATVTNVNYINRIGGDNLVRFKLGGSKVNPRLESSLEQFNKSTISFKGDLGIDNSIQTGRDKRTQVTTILTAEDASKIGLEKTIRNYSGAFDASNNIQYYNIGRTDEFRKKHHISEINVLEQSGMRYVYGLPVYSIKQKDFTFSVDNIGDPNTGITNFSTDEPTISSRHMANKAKLDGYVMAQETPAYASSFLLTGLLSPDYVDVNGDGITEDDLGGAVKFDYTKTGVHKWRTPRNNLTATSAHFNEGLKSEKKDNKATISYGEREVWYLNAIESKSMVAVFKTESRDDAKGVIDSLDGRVNQAEDANKKLKQIDLYTKAEIKAKGITNARPIKTVHFDYAYTLCKGTPDNKNAGSGKLTLKSVYFSYNGQTRVNKDRYVFNYGDSAQEKDNPTYKKYASDKWGTYKDTVTNPAINIAANPGGLTNADYPFTSSNKTKNDEYAAAWSLKKILLPSGGQMEIQYEADDYAYVQNRRACNMFNIYGLGNSTNSSTNNGLYNNGLPFPLNSGTSTDNYYVYVKLPQALLNTDAVKQKQEIFNKYLEGVNQVAFKLLINMPKGPEPLTVYAYYDDYGLCTNSASKDIIYIKLRAVDGKSPLAKSAIGFITENLPGQAFEGYEVEVDGVKAFVEMIGAMLTSIKDAFKNVDEQMRSAGKARTIVLDKSFIRLDNPTKMKYGGGVRVKKVIVKDNWQKMLTRNGTTTYGFTSTYGQEYDYTTSEKINGIETVISSGVASYEPGLGSEENPFREIVAFSNKMPLASAQYGAIEMPMLEGLYPSPGVGYSKVTVRSIHRKGTHGDSALRSAIGKQVTEFYTAKEFPVYAAYTPMNSMEFHRNSFFNLLYKDITDRKVTSQGFLVETNDMHGKMKSQIAFSESDEKTPLSYSYHTYKNTGKNGLNDKVDFVYNDQGGAVVKGNMGIDMELMTDVREFRVQSHGFNGQIQTDFFTFVPFPIFIVPMLPIKTYTENKYRSVTCTKLINYHAIEDSVIVMDKGSVISTKTIAYDAESGTPIVTKTANEFNDPIYNVNYPAYWAYSGMSLAYKNIDRTFESANFADGRLTIPGISNINEIFESGDELMVTNALGGTSGCMPESAPAVKLWAYDINKNTTPLTVPAINKDLVFLDKDGNIFTKSNVSFRIIRSGKRNLLGNSVSTVTTMANPIVNGMLTINSNSKTVAASAMEFKDKWQTDYDVFKKYKTIQVTTTPPELVVNGDFSAGPSGFLTQFNYYPSCNFPPWRYYNICNSGAPHGNIMGFNGAALIAWEQRDLTVVPNTTYTFSAAFFNVNSDPTIIQVYVNNIPISNSFALPYNGWNTYTFTWNSVNSTSANITIRDHNGNENGNDFAIDDISFKAKAGCVIQEVEDCAGYLEKKINPYVKGLIGNYKGFRSLVYYADRVPVAVSPNATNIRSNGYLNNFSMYWSFNGLNNLVPDEANTKWVWNSQNMKYNSKGLELETKDALNIYTAAQYGFAKTQPVAVAKNSRYNEMFAESFEDYDFNERVNPLTGQVCERKHIDFPGFVNTDLLGLNAHSGRNVYAVPSDTTYTKTLSVKNVIDSFDLKFKKDTVKTLINPGGNFTVITAPSGTTVSQPTFSNFQMQGNQGFTVPYGTFNTFLYETVQYFQVTVQGNYEVTSRYQVGSDFGTIYGTNYYWEIYSVETGNIIPLTNLYINVTSSGGSFISHKIDRLCLPVGKFKMVCRYGGAQGNYVCQNNTFCQQGIGYSYTVTLSDPLTSYKDLSTAAGCITSIPIAAKDSMITPSFHLFPNKKMQFSAWVREGCSTVPCTKTDYTNSNIEIWSGGTNLGLGTIKRTGAIIEGWQKIEGEFTVPLNATTAEIRFINTNSVPMYVDDIRIHPFNANMKSYAYDSRTLRLSAELDENNYASFYEYDEEGQLVRVKKETSQGIKTINETRASKQKVITDLQ